MVKGSATLVMLHTYSGDPNGHVTGAAGDWCNDQSGGPIWVCQGGTEWSKPAGSSLYSPSSPGPLNFVAGDNTLPWYVVTGDPNGGGGTIAVPAGAMAIQITSGGVGWQCSTTYTPASCEADTSLSLPITIVLGAPAAVLAETAPTLPLTITTGVNDQFKFQGSSNDDILETFTIAAGTYTSLESLEAQIAASTGSIESETFDSYCDVGDNGTNISIVAVASLAADNGDTLSEGNGALAALGFTGTATFSGGIDSNGSFSYTLEGSSSENFSIASGTYTTIGDFMAAVSEAVGEFSDTFGDHVIVNNVGDTNLLFILDLASRGAYDNDSNLGGSTACLTVMGFTETFIFSGGVNAIWTQVWPTASVAGGQIIKAYPFSYNDEGLSTGESLASVSAGDLLIDAWIEIDTAWDGTTPLIDYGIAGYSSSGFLNNWGSGAADASEADQGVFTYLKGPSGRGFRVSQLSLSATVDWASQSSFPDGGLFDTPPQPAEYPQRIVPLKFVDDSSIEIWVTQTGFKGDADPGSTQGSGILYLVTATPA